MEQTGIIIQFQKMVLYTMLKYYILTNGMSI